MPRILTTKVIVYLLFLLVLDLSLMPAFRVYGIYPQWMYLMVLYAAFQWGWQSALPMAVYVGLLRDMSGGELFGIETASLALSGFVLALWVKKMDREAWSLRIMTAAGFIFCSFTIHLCLVRSLTDIVYGFWYGLSVALGSAFMTAFCMPLFFYLTSRWFSRRAVLKQYELFE